MCCLQCCLVHSVNHLISLSFVHCWLSEFEASRMMLTWTGGELMRCVRCQVLMSADVGEDAECHAAKLLEVILLQFKGSIDHVSRWRFCVIFHPFLFRTVCYLWPLQVRSRPKRIRSRLGWTLPRVGHFTDGLPSWFDHNKLIHRN